MAVICLVNSVSILGFNDTFRQTEVETACTYVKPALELAIAAQLHKDELVNQEAHKIEGLRDVCAVVTVVCHFGGLVDLVDGIVKCGR